MTWISTRFDYLSGFEIDEALKVPELPEVEVVRQGLNQVSRNHQITGGTVLLARTIAHPFCVAQFLSELEGAAIAQWIRRGKYLLAQLVDGNWVDANKDRGWLGVHLRMTGQLLWLPSGQDTLIPKHTRVRLYFRDGWELRFVDTRTFGQMWWVPPDVGPETIIGGLGKLGPEPLSADFSMEYWLGCLQGRKRSIKAFLLDQSVVAGMGNIYVDEALFVAGIRPTTQASQLSLKQGEDLHRAIVQVLESAITAGGTTFSDFLNVHGINGNYGGLAWVYGRGGEPCRRCGSIIERLKLAGRSAHYCPTCQV